MKNQLKNPIFWSVLSFAVGIGFGAWGLIKEEADNYIGQGALKGIGIALILLGAVGMFAFGGKKK